MGCKPTATKKTNASDIKPIGNGFFGNIYNQFKGKAKEAFEFLIKHKTGDLLGVFHRKEIGDIDLVWGNAETNDGLEHIIDKHVVRLGDFASVDEMVTTSPCGFATRKFFISCGLQTHSD